MKRVVFHPEASEEYLAAIEYYAAISVELGTRFDSEIQRPVGEICRDPKRFYRLHPPAQRALSVIFPYAVIYLKEGNYMNRKVTQRTQSKRVWHPQGWFYDSPGRRVGKPWASLRKVLSLWSL